MNDDQFGRQWVYGQLLSLASEVNIAVDSVMWETTADDVRRSPQTVTLVVVMRGSRFVDTFTVADLEDLQGDSGLQSTVRSQLRRLVLHASAEEQEQR